MSHRCKRIIDGKTYNTETATKVGAWDYSHEEYGNAHGEELYKSRFGAFFVYSWTEDGPEGPEQGLEPLTDEAARAWLERHRGYDVDTIEAHFGKMPEAGSSESKISLRLPDSLRAQIAAAAKANKQSINAWLIRGIETLIQAENKKPKKGSRR